MSASSVGHAYFKRNRLIFVFAWLASTFPDKTVEKVLNAFNAWAYSTASIFSRDDERIIGQGIIAQCQLKDLNPSSEAERQTAANGIVKMAEETVGSISQYMWDIAVLRIGQLASEMNVSMGGQSVGGSNGNADELTNWDGIKKKGLWR